MQGKKLTEEQVDWLSARLLELGIEGDENSVALGAIVQMVGSGEMDITIADRGESGSGDQETPYTSRCSTARRVRCFGVKCRRSLRRQDRKALRVRCVVVPTARLYRSISRMWSAK